VIIKADFGVVRLCDCALLGFEIVHDVVVWIVVGGII
jgi:hypothetical protein